MTATNHAATGALVAVLINRPLIALPVAFIMHFVMDAIPHFGLNIPSITQRNKDKIFKRVLIGDIIIAGLLLIILPLLLSPEYNWWLVFLCSFACMAPDLVWGWRLYFELKNKTERAKSWFSKFHATIQWRETPVGAFVEIAWFCSILYLILYFQ